MKLFTRFVSLLLAAIMLLSFAACANNEDDTEEKTSSENSESVAEEKTAAEEVGVEVKDYDTTLKFMTNDADEWSTVEVWVEKDSEDPIESAVFYRNLAIKDKYGITIEQDFTTASSIISKLGGIHKTGGQDYAGVFTTLSTSVSLAEKNYLYDLKTEVPNIDLTRSWWDAKAASGLSIGGKLFYATGDLLTTDNDGTFILMFNKTIMTNKNIMSATSTESSSIYELVKNYEWTFDEMLAMEKLASDEKEDIDPYEDTIGFAMTGAVPYSLLYGGGFTSCTKDSDDIPVYSLDVELTSQIVEKAYLIYGDKTLAANMEKGGTGAVFTNGQNCFGGNHALFFGEVLQCVSRLRGFDVDFGVIPYPMLDANQKAYYSVMNPVGGMVSVPSCLTTENAEISGAAIEVMAYMSKYNDNGLTKAYYDITLIAKGTKDEESEPMIDLILETRVYDLGYVFGWGSLVSKLGNCISTGGKVASTVKSAESSFNKMVQKELKKLKVGSYAD